jgi:hypothetical protein
MAQSVQDLLRRCDNITGLRTVSGEAQSGSLRRWQQLANVLDDLRSHLHESGRVLPSEQVGVNSIGDERKNDCGKDGSHRTPPIVVKSPLIPPLPARFARSPGSLGNPSLAPGAPGPDVIAFRTCFPEP